MPTTLFHSALTAALVTDTLIFARGWTTSGNNGLKVVAAASTTTLTKITTALTAETPTIASGARIDVCGRRFTDLVWDDTAAHRVDPNPTIFPIDKHMIVTNTKGTDGRVANGANEYWNTDALDDSEPDTVAHANYAGKDDTDKNAKTTKTLTKMN